MSEKKLFYETLPSQYSLKFSASKSIQLPVKYVVRAIWDCAADQDNELSFKEGNLIDILKDDDPGWFFGRIGDQEGLVPANYCVRNDEKFTALAVCDSITGKDDYLVFDKGDIFSIMGNHDASTFIGWFRGKTGKVIKFQVRENPKFICTLSYSSYCRGESRTCYTCHTELCQHHYETHKDVAVCAVCDYHNCTNVAEYYGRCGYHANRCLGQNYDGR